MSGSSLLSRRRLVGLCALLVAAALALAWAWNSKPLRLRDRMLPRRLAEVYPGFLYRSGQIAPNLIEATLRELEIGVIVDLTGERRDEAQLTERAVANRLGVAYHNFSLSGSGTGAVSEYAAAIEVIARAERGGERVLVHCRAGDRRTGGVVAAYQRIVRHEPWSRAMLELERFNHKPLESSRLLPYLHENISEMQTLLLQRGVIAGADLQALDESSHLSSATVVDGRVAD